MSSFQDRKCRGGGQSLLEPHLERCQVGLCSRGVPLTALDEACARRGRAVAALLALGPPGLMPDNEEVPDLPGNPFQNVLGEKALLPLLPVLLASPSLPPLPGENKDVPNLRAGRGWVSAKPPSGVAHVTPGLCPSRRPAAHRGLVRTPIPAAALTGTGDDLGAVVGLSPKCGRLLWKSQGCS